MINIEIKSGREIASDIKRGSEGESKSGIDDKSAKTVTNKRILI